MSAVLAAVLGFIAFPVLFAIALAVHCFCDDMRCERQRQRDGCMFFDCWNTPKRGMRACKDHSQVPCHWFLLKHPYDGGNGGAESEKGTALRVRFYEEYAKTGVYPSSVMWERE